MQDEFSIAEAKNILPSIIHRVEKGPYVKITRRGKPVAVMLSIKEYEQLRHKTTGFWDALLKFRESMKADDCANIIDAEFENLRDKDAGRKVVV